MEGRGHPFVRGACPRAAQSADPGADDCNIYVHSRAPLARRPSQPLRSGGVTIANERIEADMSIGAQKGPRIGVQKGPLAATVTVVGVGRRAGAEAQA